MSACLAENASVSLRFQVSYGERAVGGRSTRKLQWCDPMETCAERDGGWAKIAPGVLFVYRVEQPRGLISQPEPGPDVCDRRAVGQLQLAPARARPLAQARKQPHHHSHGRSVD